MFAKNNIINFVKSHIVVIIAFLLATITTFIIPINKNYLTYFDFKTLTCLFLVSLIVSAYKDINLFYVIARKIITKFNNFKICFLVLIYITFIGSMLIANDMALLTFLPLGYFILKQTHNEKYEAFVFVMQNIAANLGGMLTPFGNPQNLYLYSKFNIATFEFVKIMFVPFIIAIILITMSVVFIPNVKMKIYNEGISTDPTRTIIYSILFIFSISIIFRQVPYIYGLIFIPLLMLFLDKKAFKNVDYSLLLTFCFFFVFAGNMAQIEIIRKFFIRCLNINTLLTTVISCQLISNVPSSILISQFTNNYKALLYGVNIGGCGTLIASLASLITFFAFKKENKDKVFYYLKIFTTLNLFFLVVLFIVCSILLK